MGGTMRLGADPVKLHEGTKAREIFGEAVIYKRHRHRYEVNNQLRRRLEDEGLVCGGTSPDERLVEMIELPDHPFFVASQYHPEFNSRPNRPEPLFREFVGAAATHAGEEPADGGETRAGRGRRRERRRRPPLGLSARASSSLSGVSDRQALRDLRPALRDPQPDRGGARGRRHDGGRAAGAGARGERGRRRRPGRSGRRQPAGAVAGDARRVGDVLRPHRHRPAPGTGRGGQRRRRLPQSRRDDPRRRQQGGGRGLHGAGRAGTPRSRRRSGSSCS